MFQKIKITNLFFTLVILLFLVASCDKENDDTPVKITNNMDVSVDGTNYNLKSEDIGGNENCDYLFVNTYFYKKNEIQFRINFSILKSGELVKASYQELNISQSGNQHQLFLTPNFNPTSSFSISNFQYNSNLNTVKFDFEGTVFLEENVETSRFISGSVDILKFVSTPCLASIKSITYNSNDFQFNTTTQISTQYANLSQEHQYYSNNGYKIKFLIENDFWNLPIGNYEFGKSSIQNKVTFEECIGALQASQSQFYDADDWKNYQTSGSFTVENKFIENGYKKISGKLNINVSYENQTIYTINDADFTAGSFVD